MIVLRRLALGLTCLLIAVLSDGPVDEGEKTTESGDTQTPGWVGPMRKVHARFSGDPGTFAQFGDSITDSRAFWFSLKWKRGNASEEMLAAPFLTAEAAHIPGTASAQRRRTPALPPNIPSSAANPTPTCV